MKSFTAQIRQASLVVMALSALGMMNSAQATGTAAGTNISNVATVNYQVNGVAQTPVSNIPSTFTVDRKVDLTVTAVSATTTNPGAANVGVLYTVTNSGNGTDSFTLAGTNQGGDSFDVTNVRIYRDNGTTPNVFDAGDTLVSAAVSFTADQTINFFIVSDIPLSATNGQNSVVNLAATTTSTATAGADTAGVDVVFADSITNGTAAGTENANNQYNISTAALQVTKSAVVVNDPVNGATDPKAIPGATVEYTITVLNNGAAAATSVVLSDDIPANTAFDPGSMQLNSATLTDGSGDDAGTYTSTGTPNVSINVGTVAASGGIATAKFRVTIN